MLLTGTLIVLAAWLAFIWFADPDGFRRRRALREMRTPLSPTGFC